MICSPTHEQYTSGLISGPYPPGCQPNFPFVREEPPLKGWNTYQVPSSLFSQMALQMLFRIPATLVLMGVTPTQPVGQAPGHSSTASAPLASGEMDRSAMV